ncbi:MAG: hypothetical protein JWM73_2476 [Solirubrobacterales bacterium]|nr:hypothetical protein [Solirubrobacterales bacterium]
MILALVAGCGGDRAPKAPAPARTTATSPAPAGDRTPQIRRARCPANAGNCAAATGRIIYRELVDADGDGDLHLVVTGGSVTGPGFTVFDIEKGLRPRRDPRIGDLASAAGPVYRGSYGQRQIQATELHILRRR